MKMNRFLATLCALSVISSCTALNTHAEEIINSVSSAGASDSNFIDFYTEENIFKLNSVTSEIESSYIDEATLYYLNTEYEEYVSIPNSFAQSYQIKLDGKYQSVTYSADSDRVTVNSNGLVTPKMNTAITFCYAGAGTLFERTYGDDGSTVITVNADDKVFKYKINTVSYGYYYCEQIVQKWMKTNIKSSMTEMEKLEKVCEYVCSYDYKATLTIGGIGMVLENGGDCQTSSSLVLYMCKELGMKGWINKPSYGGIGHVNVIIKFSDDSAYEVDCGYNTKAPRYYSIEPYSSELTSNDDYVFETLDDGTLKIIEYIGEDSVVVIPQEAAGKSVTAIGDRVFAEHKEITSLVLPETLTCIGNNCFRQCSELRYIEGAEHLTDVGYYAFDETAWYDEQPDGVVYLANIAYCWKGAVPENTKVTLREGTLGIAGFAFYSYDSYGTSYSANVYTHLKRRCNNIISVEIPESVQIIGVDAFEYCDGLQTVNLKGGRVIKSGAFSKCEKLKNVSFSQNVNEIEGDVFSDCTALEKITLPNSVSSIGTAAFNGCENLQEITLPEHVDYLGKSVFAYCRSLKSIRIPEGPKQLIANMTRGGFFKDCFALESIVIPESVMEIEGIVNCHSLKEVSLPANVRSIDEGYDFLGCESLTAINVAEDNTSFCSEDGVLYNKSKTKLIRYPAAKKGTSFIVPDSVTTISRAAFSGNKYLKTITLSDKITKIPQFAFSNCSVLESVSLTQSINEIGSSAFANCPALKSVTMPKSVETIGTSVFLNCTALKKIGVESGNTNYKTIDGVLFSSDMQLIQYPAGKTGTNYIIPDGTTAIVNNAFRGNTILQEVTVPDSVIEIGDYAFEDCTSLCKLNMPSVWSATAVSFGNSVFENCTSLISIGIPEKTEKLGYYMFEDCTNLQYVVFPESIASIGASCFHGCTSLTDIYLHGSEDAWNAITITSVPGEWSSAKGNARLSIEDSVLIHYHSTDPSNIIKGDLNGDDEFNVADVVLLQKWLLAVPDTHLSQWQAADFCKDGRLDVFDLCLMKRALIEVI